MATQDIRVLTYSAEMEYDSNGNMIYYGLAIPGSSTSDSVWQIRQLTYDVSGNLLSILWARGSRGFTNVWTNRATYTYS